VYANRKLLWLFVLSLIVLLNRTILKSDSIGLLFSSLLQFLTHHGNTSVLSSIYDPVSTFVVGCVGIVENEYSSLPNEGILMWQVLNSYCQLSKAYFDQLKEQEKKELVGMKYETIMLYVCRCVYMCI